MTAPRPGSTIDRAVRALQSSGPLPRAELARLIERDDEELDGLLRYGVRMGLLVRSNGDEDVSYALGDGVPVEGSCPPPAEAPAPMEVPATAPAKAEIPRPAPPAPPARPAIAVAWPALAPAGGPAPASPDLPLIGCAAYRPRVGSQVAALLAYLYAHAPHGGDVWLTSKDLEPAGVQASAVQAMLIPAFTHAVVDSAKADGRLRFQTGAAAVVLPGPRALPPRPAPRPPAPAPAQDPAPAAETAAFLLKQLDGEIERLEYSLRIVRRRREEFAAALKGARFAPPQFGGGGVGVSVREVTERASGSPA